MALTTEVTDETRAIIHKDEFLLFAQTARIRLCISALSSPVLFSLQSKAMFNLLHSSLISSSAHGNFLILTIHSLSFMCSDLSASMISL